MRRMAILAAVVAMAAGSAWAVKPGSETAAASGMAAARQAAAKSSNAFGFDVYGKVRTRDGNVFISPVSLSTALVMTWDGARGKTAEEMTKVLHLEGPAAESRGGFGALVKALQAEKGSAGVELSMANRLWGIKQYPYRPEFLAAAEGTFGAGLEPVDFGRPREASEKINAWVEEKTRGKIKDLIPPGSLDALTRLVLTNAVYFKGAWDKPFEGEATADGEFQLGGGKKTGARFMHQQAKFACGETEIGGEKVQVLQMDYVGKQVAMTVLLPKLGGIEAMEKALTAEAMDKAAADLARKEVAVTLPRFKMSDSLKMAEVLVGMGMVSAFDASKSDFTGITTREGLYIKQVFHKTFVEVNEKGTEAAGATGVVMAAESAAVGKPLEFKADRPFVFVIREKTTGAVMFVGRVSDPAK